MSVESFKVDGWTALLFAASEGHLEVTRLLINSGCDKNVKDNKGRTALHVAAQKRHLQVIRHLISAGIGPMIKTKEGKTPYDLAVAKRPFEPSYKIYNEVVNYLKVYIHCMCVK
ncbi:Hypothetical predicted protein [Mytilus galloprovincialis]|uniref:Uncharacterized protein n=1 Tax=Mytilus galloprovincialis TaxID=29158 RepID=A0A8B6H1S1_MYTGA|nr:Hypothetical predicted protein [Mytilus galloprovincialis]